MDLAPITKWDLLYDHSICAVLMKQPHKAKFQQFINEKNIKLMFQYLWELDAAHNDLLNVKIKPPSKNEALSEDLRKQGNKFYQKNKFQQALEKYNMCIMVAPHPDTTQGENSAEMPVLLEDHDTTNYKKLALGFANRSAVLYDLKQYGKAISDIDRALKFGYPQILHCKLAERKAKCLIGLKKHKEAKALLQTTITALSSLTVADTRKSLEKLEASCLTDSSVMEQHTSDEPYEDPLSRNISSLSNDELLFAFKTPPPPILKDVNSNIPAFSSALDLTYSENSGRSVIAARDIKPGELIGVEAPYAIMLKFDDPANMRKFCCVCAARCLTPLPCTHCNLVIFCSDYCRTEGIAKFHQVECCILPTLIELDMGITPILTYRVLAQIPLLQLKSIIPKLEVEKHQKTRQLQGFNDQGVYDSSDYETLFHLEGNFGARDLNDLLEKCCKAFILTKMLIKSKCYFVDEHGTPFEPSLYDVILVGSTVFMHLINIQPNSLEICEYQVVPLYKSPTGLDAKSLGGGIYPALSLFNHSCHISATRITYGCHKAIYSLSFITKGSEVCISYGEKFFSHSIDQRRSQLLRNYKFKCNCEACTNNWPTLHFLEKFPKLKQSEKMILRGATGKIAKLNPHNRKRIESYMKELFQKFHNCYLDAMKGKNYADTGAIAIEVLEFIDRFADMPCSLYTDAQEMLEFFVLEKQAPCTYVN